MEANQEFLKRLSLISDMLGIQNFMLNLEQLSNDELMEELHRQNDEYFEKILRNQELILEKLDKIIKQQQ